MPKADLTTRAKVTALEKAFAMARAQGTQLPSQQRFTPVLTEDRLSQELKKVSVVSQKVYQAVPTKTAWSIGNIEKEMIRKGFNHDRPAVKTALEQLVTAGLISNGGGMFMRSKVKGEPMPKPEPATPEPPHKNGSPVDRLFDLAADLDANSKQAAELLAEFREMTLALWEENEHLRKQAAEAEQSAKEKIMKRFLEA